jgi:REP-associated tyrosine transposase
MARTPRCELPDGYFHVTSRGNRGVHIFLEDVDRFDFLHLLGSVVETFKWRVHAHCLMGTHYHLIVEASRERLSDGMRKLNGAYARRFNRRHGFKGHLFEERFSSWFVRDEQHFAAAVHYVLDNPVRAGLCQHAGDWQWAASAYRT